MGKGLEKLQTAVEKDCSKDGGTLHPEGCVTCGAKCFHNYCDKYKWVIDRAKSYGEAMGLHWEDILDGWEESRNYWYMNYYQECNQPKITPKMSGCLILWMHIGKLWTERNSVALPVEKKVQILITVKPVAGRYMDFWETSEKAFLYM